MIFNLFVLSLIGLYNLMVHNIGISLTVVQLVVAVLTASLLDLLINYVRFKKVLLPKTGIISGLFIGTVLDVNQVWYIPIVAAVLAILSKNIIRIKGRNIFNPASFGMVLTSLTFGVSLGWWAATFLPWILVMGILILYKIRGYQTITFLIFYYIFSILPAFSSGLAEAFFGTQVYGLINPFVLFFSFFMLTEPKTAPFGKKSKYVYGFLVAFFNYILIQFFPALSPILPLLVANVFVPILNQKIR